MLGRTHMVFGALFWAGGATVTAEAVGMDLSPTEMVVGLGIATVASLLPDIDHPDALMTRGWIPGMKLFGPLARPLGLFLSLPPRIVGMMARSVMGHRGGTHSLVFMAFWTLLALPMYALLVALLAYLASFPLAFTPLGFNPDSVNEWLLETVPQFMPFVMLGVGIGYFSHLFADSLNTVPVPWLWPFSKRRIFLLPKGLRIRVESPGEWLVQKLAILLFVVVAFFTIVQPAYHQARNVVDEKVQERSQPAGSSTPAHKVTRRSGD